MFNYEEQKALEIVLDFVERYNKQDAEVEVAHAHHLLEKLLEDMPKTNMSGLADVFDEIMGNPLEKLDNLKIR